MDRQKAKLEDVLGFKHQEIKPCIYSREGQIPFKYNPCNQCTKFHSLTCDSYRSEIVLEKERIHLKRDKYDFIRKANDGMVI